MNIDHMRAFLEVAATGSFQTAGDRLNVTQSTVSARIRVLEERLDRILFHRKRTGAELTAAGRQFHRYAQVAVRAWEQARQEIALPEELTSVVGLGVQVSLWDRIGPGWLAHMEATAPEIGLYVEADYSQPLTQRVCDGLLDLCVLYTPHYRANLRIEQLLDERLIMVSTDPGRRPASGWMEDYVFVDWGEPFKTDHALAFPDMRAARVSVGLSGIALAHVRRRGGAFYDLERQARPLIDAGQLFEVAGAPAFRRPAYLAYPEDPIDPDRLQLALDALRATVAADTAG
ncbi:MAG: LysR family transcriptional regulator [Alphaproteobacteria bacterium]|nr:LysR family transcriptional regulator [Alphaproteobacteria bacterium]